MSLPDPTHAYLSDGRLLLWWNANGETSGFRVGGGDAGPVAIDDAEGQALLVEHNLRADGRLLGPVVLRRPSGYKRVSTV